MDRSELVFLVEPDIADLLEFRHRDELDLPKLLRPQAADLRLDFQQPAQPVDAGFLRVGSPDEVLFALVVAKELDPPVHPPVVASGLLLGNIYAEVTGEEFPVSRSDDSLLRGEDWELLREVCGQEEGFFEMQASLLDIEREYRGMSRRAGIYEALEDRLKAGQFANEEEALTIRRDEEHRRYQAKHFGAEEREVQRRMFEEEVVEEV